MVYPWKPSTWEVKTWRSGVQDQAHLLGSCRPAWTRWCCLVLLFAFLEWSQAVYITLYFLHAFSLNQTDHSLGDLKAFFYPFLRTNLTSTASHPACFSLDALVLIKAHPQPELTALPEAVFVEPCRCFIFLFQKGPPVWFRIGICARILGLQNLRVFINVI